MKFSLPGLRNWIIAFSLLVCPAGAAAAGTADWSSAGPRMRSAVILPGGGARLTRPL